MRQALCLALAQFAGQPLTQEVALQIVQAVMGARAPIALDRFAPLEHGAYRIQLERLADALPELHPLHVLHWGETEGYRHGLALDPDYAAMVARDQAGGCLQLTCRHHGELVGHLRMWFHASSLHTQTPLGDEDTLFIRPDHRGSFLVMSLMRYAESCLRELGVREIRANSKLANRADVLMKRLGYTPFATQFCKIFKEPTDGPQSN